MKKVVLLVLTASALCRLALAQPGLQPNFAWETGIDAGIYQQVAALNAVTTDELGNVYVTGKRNSNAGCSDLLTIKYGPAGNKLWEAQYNSPTNSDEAGVFIGLDHQGNVYVAGTSTFRESFNRQATGIIIKYNSVGTELWARLLGLDEQNYDVWSGFTIDHDGNIYMTGSRESYSTRGYSTDYVTTKFDANGNQLWEATYAGIADGSNAATAITVDQSGNVFVSGISYETPWWDGRKASATIKYDPDGTEQWVHRYTHPDSLFINRSSSTISVDQNERSAISVLFQPLSWGGTRTCITIQYDAAGQIEWESEDASLISSLVHDPEGNLYVAGRDNEDLVVRKYKASGEEDWTYVHSTPEGSLTAAYIQRDIAGEIIIGAALFSNQALFPSKAYLLKLSADGNLIWQTSPPGQGKLSPSLRDITLDRSGNILVNTISGTMETLNGQITKYDPTGQLLWNRKESGENVSEGTIYAMELDENGNTYVTGATKNIGSGLDYFTSRIGHNGVVDWTVTYNGPANKADIASFIALDDSGNVYVSGMSTGIDMDLDYATIKYSPTGKELWMARHSGTTGDEDRVNGLLITPTGIVIGGSAGFVKYDHMGNIIWTNATPSLAIAEDVYGNIYSANDAEVKKLTSNGLELWAVAGGGKDVVVDGYGDVYVSWAYYWGGELRKFDSYGTMLWSRPVGGFELVLDEQSNILFANDSRAYKYSPTGTLIYSVTTNLQWVNNVVIDKRGNLHVAGVGNDQYHLWGGRMVKLQPNGTLEWATSLAPQSAHRTFELRATNAGEILVAGQTIRSDMSSRPTVTKLTEVVSSVGTDDNLPMTTGLSDNYPNPFNPETHIRYRLKESGFVSLKVYDVLGREVAQLVNEQIEAGDHTVSWNASTMASGVYFYTLNANGVVETRRMMLVR